MTKSEPKSMHKDPESNHSIEVRSAEVRFLGSIPYDNTSLKSAQQDKKLHGYCKGGIFLTENLK
jgi:hypothetical protein